MENTIMQHANKLIRNMLFATLVVMSFASQANTLAPDELIKETSQQVLKALEDQQEQLKKDPHKVYTLVDEIILPHIDFEKMARLVLGKNWRKASPEQQQAFTTQFRQLLVRTYSTSLSDYTGEKVTYLPFRMEQGATDVTIKTIIDQKTNVPVHVDYDLSLNSNEWKVYDIKINGLSLVTNNRSAFSKEIRTTGIDGLIKRLKDKNQQ